MTQQGKCEQPPNYQFFRNLSRILLNYKKREREWNEQRHLSRLPMLPLPRAQRMITWDKVFVPSLILGASLTQNPLSISPSITPSIPPPLDPPPSHPAAGACACLRAGRLQGGGCASQACPRTKTRRMRRRRRRRRVGGSGGSVCVEVAGVVNRRCHHAIEPSPATFGGCVRARVRARSACKTYRMTLRHNDTLTYVQARAL